ncbi:MAG TPA: hypothetical protein VFN57_18650 [Thermomicrobiaceae bacterium]|nr:hypothetical protein [Thermomicrobiaceae bacterium]
MRAPFPAYALDCATRLVAWNGLTARLVGATSGDPTLRGLLGRSVLAAWFAPASPLARLVADPDAFLPALIRALRYELRQYEGEAWAAGMLDDLRSLPGFRARWEEVDREPAAPSAARALVPVRLDVPGAGRLQFHLSSEPLARDARFRVIYYFPADPATIRACAAWAAHQRVATGGADRGDGAAAFPFAR